MKILHVTTTYAPAWSYGGPPRSVSNLCEGLVALGHEVTVLTTNAGLEDVPTISVGRPTSRNGVTVEYHASRRNALGVVSGDLSRAIATRMREFDIAHLCGAWQPVNPGAARAARRAGVPYVVSPRGMLQRYSFTQRPWKKRLWYWLIERGILRGAAAMHCTSRLEVEEMARFRLPTPRVLVPNSVPTATWRRDSRAGATWRQALGSAPDELVLLAAGRLHHKKGLEFLVPVVRELSDSHPVHLVLAGPDEDGTGARLRREFSDMPFRTQLTLAGALDTTGMVAAYSGADVFVFPSRDENFGNVAIEALSCGCPAVLSDGIGVAADVVDLALVRVASRDVGVWVREIRSLRSTPRLDEVRAAVIEQIDARFSRLAVARAMEGHYQRLVSSARGVTGS